jgi:two-component system, NarL family, response regulator NreC
MENGNINIALVDDHEIFRKGLEEVLSKTGHFKVTLSLSGADELFSELPLKAIDILILDLQLPNYQPDDILKEIRKAQPDLKILYLTLIRGNKYFNKLSKIGFEGYILKDSPIEELKKAIIQVAEGGTYFGERYGNEEGLNTTTIPADKILNLLSNREMEVLKLVAQELSSSQIAARLFVSVSTVDSHRKNMMVKLGVDNIVGLIKIAISNNLI